MPFFLLQLLSPELYLGCVTLCGSSQMLSASTTHCMPFSGTTLITLLQWLLLINHAVYPAIFPSGCIYSNKLNMPFPIPCHRVIHQYRKSHWECQLAVRGETPSFTSQENPILLAIWQVTLNFSMFFFHPEEFYFFSATMRTADTRHH